MRSTKILGHAHALKQLGVLFKTGRIPSALIFNGPKGVGKFLAAKEFAKLINCKSGNQKSSSLFKKEEVKYDYISPCQKCLSCVQIESGAHPDVRIIDKNFQAQILQEPLSKQQSLKIDTIRELSSYADKRPILSEHKIFIIDGADDLVFQAQNAMLKLLEEPPKNTHFFLVTSKKAALLPTIISRSHCVEFGQLPKNLVEEILTRNKIPLDEASFLSNISCGSISKALDMRRLIKDFPEYDPGDRTYAFMLSQTLGKDSGVAREKANLMLDIYLSKMHEKWIIESNASDKEGMGEVIKELLKFKDFLRQNVMPTPLIEIAALKCLRHNITLNFKKKAI